MKNLYYLLTTSLVLMLLLTASSCERESPECETGNFRHCGPTEVCMDGECVPNSSGNYNLWFSSGRVIVFDKKKGYLGVVEGHDCLDTLLLIVKDIERGEAELWVDRPPPLMLNGGIISDIGNGYYLDGTSDHLCRSTGQYASILYKTYLPDSIGMELFLYKPWLEDSLLSAQFRDTVFVMLYSTDI